MPDITLEIAAGTNTIPVVVNQDSAIERYLEARFRNEEWPFASSIEDDFAAAIVQTDAISGAAPKQQELPAVGVNEYLHPGGASRFGRGLFLVDHKHIAKLINHCWGITWDGKGAIPTDNGTQNSAEIKYGYDQATFSPKVFLQTPIQIDATSEVSGKTRQLYLCPFVDGRYKVLHTAEKLTVTSEGGESWNDVTTEIQGKIDGSVSPYGTVSQSFLNPDPGYFSVARSLGYALDHIAASTGRRVYYDAENDTFQMSTFSVGESALNNAVNAMRGDNIGVVLGDLNGNPFAPAARDYSITHRKLYDHYDNESYDTVDGSSQAGQGGQGYEKPHIVSTFYLEHYGGTSDSTSNQNLSNLAAELAEANYNFQTKQFCVTYARPVVAFSLLDTPFCDYTLIKWQTKGELPQIVTTHKSVETGIVPFINISQTSGIYRHNQELARITLSGSGIAEGASSGQGSIAPNKSETSYNGTPRSITVNLLGPASSAIPAGSVLSCYFQSNDGWYVVQGEAGPPGGAGSPWIQFRANSSIGAHSSGQWSVYVLQHRNCEGLLDDAGENITCGSSLTVSDPHNLFPDTVFAVDQNITRCLEGSSTPPGLGGSVGTAYYRTPTTACNDPPGTNRWEVETCTQSVNKMEVQVALPLNGCIKAAPDFPGQTYPVQFFNPNRDFLSQAPARDFPMEARDATPEEGSCWAIDVENPYAYTIDTGDAVIIERWSDKGTTRATDTNVPHNLAQSSVRWIIAEVLKDYYGNAIGEMARYILVELLDSAVGAAFQGQGSAAGEYFALNDYWEGKSPASFGADYLDTCRPKMVFALDTACKEAGTRYVGSFDPGRHLFMLFATESAMLGEASQITSITNATPLGNCGITFTQQTHFGFPCDFLPTSYQWQPTLQSLDVITSAGTNPASGELCLYKDTIQVCDYTQSADTQCVDICICVSCADSNCVYTYNEDTAYWVQTTPCPEGCECSGETPTNTPGPGDPTTITYPCRNPSPPVVTCTQCDGCTFGSTDCETFGYEITLPVMNATNGSGHSVVLNSGSAVISRTGDCTWEITGLIWRDFTTGTTTNATVTVTQGLPGGSTNPSCTPYAFLSLSWTPASGEGITFPTELNGSQPACAPIGYGQGGGGGCGLMPQNPGGGGIWGNVTMQTVCCTTVQAADDDAYLAMIEASKTEVIASTNFNQATLGGESPKPKRLGDAFYQEHLQMFASCGCTKDLIPVMNRWGERHEVPDIEKIKTVSTTLWSKQDAEYRKKNTMDDLASYIQAYIVRHLQG